MVIAKAAAHMVGDIGNLLIAHVVTKTWHAALAIHDDKDEELGHRQISVVGQGGIKADATRPLAICHVATLATGLIELLPRLRHELCPGRKGGGSWAVRSAAITPAVISPMARENTVMARGMDGYGMKFSSGRFCGGDNRLVQAFGGIQRRQHSAFHPGRNEGG